MPRKVYSMDEAAQHCTKGDCWVIIHGKVYNVSSFLSKHPGGADVLLGAAGKDATEEFEDAGHGRIAKMLMRCFLLGELERPSEAIGEHETASKEQGDSSRKHGGFTNQYWIVPAVVVGLSLAVGFLYWQRK